MNRCVMCGKDIDGSFKILIIPKYIRVGYKMKTFIELKLMKN